MQWCCVRISELTEKEIDGCISLMSRERREELIRIGNEKKRRSTVAGEWLARRVISRYTSTRREDIIIKKDPLGKPYAEGVDIYFSISHSSDMAVCAVDDRPIGIDVEAVRPIDMRIVSKLCTPADLEYISSGSQQEKQDRLLRVWTAKEAYFKYKGTGITGLKTISFSDIEPMLIRPELEGFVVTIVGEFDGSDAIEIKTL